MVLWYDLKKQGATNESMASNPTLRDLSGNGHDATCYNFAWTEESGISTTNYTGALVSDGVDDYALCSTLPTLDDFTIVAKRKFLNDFFCFASASDAINKGAFVLECFASSQLMVYSFGTGNLLSMAVDAIIYMTPTSYNGTAIKRGTNNEGHNLNLFRVRNGDSRYMEGVLYSFILFNRTLTTEEIEWVNKNMVEDND